MYVCIHVNMHIYTYILYILQNKISKSSKIIEICIKFKKKLFVNIVVSWLSEKDDDDDDWWWRFLNRVYIFNEYNE